MRAFAALAIERLVKRRLSHQRDTMPCLWAPHEANQPMLVHGLPALQHRSCYMDFRYMHAITSHNRSLRSKGSRIDRAGVPVPEVLTAMQGEELQVKLISICRIYNINLVLIFHV